MSECKEHQEIERLKKAMGERADEILLLNAKLKASEAERDSYFKQAQFYIVEKEKAEAEVKRLREAFNKILNVPDTGPTGEVSYIAGKALAPNTEGEIKRQEEGDE